MDKTSQQAVDAMLACLSVRDEQTRGVVHRPLHLIWVGGPKLGAMYAENLKMFALVHAGPTSPVMVWSNELSDEFVDRVGAEADAVRASAPRKHPTTQTPSKHLHLVRYDLEELMRGYPGHGVAKTIATLGKQRDQRKLFIVHLSDLLRYFLVWRFGGFYADLDILPLRPLLSFPPGWISVDTPDTSNTTCVRPSAFYRSLELTCLCNGLLTFNRGDPLLRAVLETAHTFFPHPQYGYHYGVIGALLIMYRLRELGDGYGELYPVTGDYAMCNAFKDLYPDTTVDDALVARLARKCSVAHVYGQGQSDKEVTGGERSLLGRLYARVRKQLASGDGVLRDYRYGVS